MGEGPSYYLFEIGKGDKCPGIGGMMAFPPELDGQIPPNWTGYVCVDDVDRTASDYMASGGSVKRPPEDIPGIGRLAVVADPHGAVLLIMTPAPMDDLPHPPPDGSPGTFGWPARYARHLGEASGSHRKNHSR